MEPLSITIIHLKLTPRLFPAQLLSVTKEYHVARNGKVSLIIYNTLVISVIMFVFALPFIIVDVTVRCSGVLKAAIEHSDLKATSSGIVEKVFVEDNQSVRKGQVLIKIRSPVLLEKESYFRDKIAEIKMLLADLEELTNPTRKGGLNERISLTSFYRQSVSDYHHKVGECELRIKKITRDYTRTKKLFDGDVISASEFEDVRFELDKANTALGLLREAQRSTWQQDLRNYSKDLADFTNQLNQVCREEESLNVTAPLKGTVQRLAGIYAGSQVFINQDLGQISPDTSLVVEVYVPPGDIGLIKAGMDVNIQVSAFNYNQWGLLHGKVDRISDDIQTTDSQAFFKVRCIPDKPFLTLRNGYRGKLKKGMGVHVRFIVAKRSLWQLLYDKVDNWMNPNTR